MKNAGSGGKKSVPPKGHSPKVKHGSCMTGIMKGSGGETGRAKPPGLNKTGPKRGNP